MNFQCPRCQANYQIKQEWLGKKVACPKCESVIQLPASPPPAGEPARPAGKLKAAQPGSAKAPVTETISPEEFPLLPEDALVPLQPVQKAPAPPEKSAIAVSRFRTVILPSVLGCMTIIASGYGLHYLLTGVLNEKLFPATLLASTQPMTNLTETPAPAIPTAGENNPFENTEPSEKTAPEVEHPASQPTPTERESRTRTRPVAPTPTPTASLAERKLATLSYWNDLRAISIPAFPTSESSIQDYQRYLRERTSALLSYEGQIRRLSQTHVDEDLLMVVRTQLKMSEEIRAICDRVGNLELFADLAVEYDAVKVDLNERELALKVNFQNQLSRLSGSLSKRYGTIFPTSTTYR